MFHESAMNLSHKTEPLEDRLQSCTDHPFKKARYAWQIKGYVNSADRQCLPMACTSDLNNAEQSFNDNRTLETSNENNVRENHIDYICSSTKTEPSGFGLEKFTVQQDIGDGDFIYQQNKEEGSNKNESLTCQPFFDKNNFKRKSELTSSNHETKARTKRIKIISSESSIESMNTIGTYTLPNESHGGSREDSDLSSYMWQKREMGFAIVDNVCNETLEVMGLSPDPKVNLLAKARLALEDHSIETAIKHQGLYANIEKKLDNEGDMDVFVNESDHKDDGLDDGIIKDNELDSMIVSCKPEVFSRSSNGNNSLSVDVQDCINTKPGDATSQCESDKFPYYVDGTITKHIPVCSESDNVCSAMEHSDSSETADMRKSSDIVIDLAVSAAIITQGLTYEDTL